MSDDDDARDDALITLLPSLHVFNDRNMRFLLRCLADSSSAPLGGGIGATVPAVLQSLKRATHTATFTHYKRVLGDEIRRDKQRWSSLAADAVALERQMDDFYVPVYIYLNNVLDQHIATTSSSITNKRPLFVGISAPQGCGKTTLTELLRVLFESDGRRCLSVSLDDFYLTGAAQDAVAQAHPANPLLQYRGNAGTHDMPLIEATLAALAAATPGGPVRVPQYDKALRGGRGDRVPDDRWLTLAAPPDVVLFEGWMLGFDPSGDDDGAERARRQAVLAARPGLAEVDGELRRYRALHEAFDAWLVVAVEDEHSLSRSPAFNPSTAAAAADSSSADRDERRPAGVGAVFRWRLQAETAMRAAGRPGLSDAQVADFVERFMPAYELYLPTLYRRGPERRGGDPAVPVLTVTVDINRHPVSSTLLGAAGSDVPQSRL